MNRDAVLEFDASDDLGQLVSLTYMERLVA
jgi:hypothetical protein